MSKKQNMFMLVVVMALLVGPLVLGMMNATVPVMDDSVGQFEPIKIFLGAANPAVDTTATQITDPDDTDNLYVGQMYTMTVNVTDADAGTDIANITAIFKGTSEIASFQWVNDSTSWVESYGTSKIRLISGVNDTQANSVNSTINFKIEWAMDDADDVDIVVQVYATDGTEVNGTHNGNYELDTDLTLASTDFIVDDAYVRKDPMRLNTLTYSFEDSGGDNYPLDNETDFWVSRAEVTEENVPAAYFEAASYSDSTGVATWNDIAASDTGDGHTETWTLYAVNQADGSSGTSLMGSSQTETVVILDSNRQIDGEDYVPPSEAFTFEQGLIITAGLVGVGVVGYLILERGSMPKRKTTRRRNVTGRKRKRGRKRKK